MKVGCAISVTRKYLTENCQHIRRQTLSLLIGNPFNGNKRNKRNHDGLNFGIELLKKHRVATFGNSKTDLPQDWIQVAISNLPDLEAYENLETGSFQGECRDVITSLHIEIYFANVGSSTNPQAKIIGVNYILAPPEDLAFKCTGFKCRLPDSTQNIEISTSVGFIDVTQPALDYYKEKPVLEAKLPHDFFYPFIRSYETSSAQKIVFCAHYMFLLLTFITITM